MDFSRVGVRMLVKDFGASYDFYTEKMGLKPAWGDRNGPYASFTAPGAAEPAFAIFSAENMAEYEGYQPPSGGGSCMLVVPCDDVDADFERLKAMGVPFMGQPQTIEDWGMRCVVLTDPDGNMIELNDSGSA